MSDTAHAKTSRLVVVVCVHTAAIEVHVVCVGRIVLCRRPIVSVCTGVLQRTGRVVSSTDSGKLYKQTFATCRTGRVARIASYVNEPEMEW